MELTEEEWRETAAAQAVLTFVIFMMSIMMVTIGGAVGSLVTRFLNWSGKQSLERQMAEKPELAAQAGRLHALFDSSRDDSLRNGLIIIATISAFEACFEDFCKGMLQMNPKIIDDKDLDKLKVPLTQFLSATEDERHDVVYESIENFVGKGAGIDRYEDILKFFNLSAAVPKPIKSEFYNAQMTRHVWAHRAGVADAKFVKQAPHLGFQQGDLVAIAGERLSEYLGAVLSYAMILTNRHRALYGLAPMQITDSDQHRNSAVMQAYLTVYPRSTE